MRYIFYITPILGLIRNYIKYKNLYFLLFFRSPIICEVIFYLIKKNNKYEYAILLALIYERWLMLIFKSLISLYNNDYLIKKEKYKKKYNLKYENN